MPKRNILRNIKFSLSKEKLGGRVSPSQLWPRDFSGHENTCWIINLVGVSCVRRGLKAMIHVGFRGCWSGQRATCKPKRAAKASPTHVILFCFFIFFRATCRKVRAFITCSREGLSKHMRKWVAEPRNIHKRKRSKWRAKGKTLVHNGPKRIQSRWSNLQQPDHRQTIPFQLNHGAIL